MTVVPGLSPLPRDHRLAAIAIPLMALSDDKEYPSGTAVFIAPSIAIGALHVIEDYHRHFTGQRLTRETSFTSTSPASFAIVAHQVVDGEHIAWRATRMWAADPLDIVVLELEPHNSTSLPGPQRFPTIRLEPPEVGTQVLAVGYPETSVDRQPDALAWKQGLFASSGVVRAIHTRKRDSGSMPFPCFQTNARFDGGMSGGPVFAADGPLVGIVSADLPPTEVGEEHASHVASIWPAMGIHVRPPTDSGESGKEYPLLELVQSGVLRVEDPDRVGFNRDTGQVYFNPTAALRDAAAGAVR